MYKVLIVDDERLIREGLQTLIDWEAHGFRVAGAADDGSDALDKLPRLQPDVIIVDIRMPGMDGLNMMRVIQEREIKPPHFIILSGHAEFQYAREALRLKADSYLLKPVDEEELIANLAKLRAVLDQERQEPPSPWKRTREQIIAAVLSGEGDAISDFEAEKAGFGWSGYELILVRPQSRSEIDPTIAAGWKTKLAEAFDADGTGAVLSLDAHAGIVLKDGVSHSKALSKIEKAAEEWGISFTAVSGGRTGSFRELGQSFQRALELMEHRFFYEGGRIYDRRPEEGPGTAASGGDPELQAIQGKLFLALDLGDGEKAAAVIRDAGAAMSAAGWSEHSIKTGFARMMGGAIAQLSRSRPEMEAKSRVWTAELFDMHGEFRFSGLLDRLAGMAHAIAGELSSGGSGQLIRRMTDLIRRRYSENLKLEMLAEILNYNSSYLGKLFKNATGEHFHTYLDKVRIEKAKELLEQGMKVYQVAEQVGYSNVDYFHAKFRKYVGISPSAYRKK